MPARGCRAGSTKPVSSTSTRASGVCLFKDQDLDKQATYAADVMESALDALAELPGASEPELRAGLADLRTLPHRPGASLGWVIHKSTASA
jgi:hypothetical protein